MPPATIVSQVMGALGQVLPGQRPIALHEPAFQGNEWQYVKDCLDSGWVSSVGSYVSRFERMLEDFTGARRAIAVVNGTAGLHVALQLAGVQPGDEVLVPTLTFVATANAVSYCGAIPHFVDCEEATLGVDPVALAAYLDTIVTPGQPICTNRLTGRPIRALVPMHTFGHPSAIEALLELCERYALTLVEDAAESLGSYYKGRHTGTFGRLGVLSFNGNKVATTGGGGAILTNDDALADRARHLTTTARCADRWHFRHDEIGYNYRLPNLNAALGCAQMETLPDMLAAKRHLAERYRDAFASVGGIRFFAEPAECRSNYWLNTLILDEPAEDLLTELLAASNEAGMMTRPAWALMHHLPMYAACPRMPLAVAEGMAKRLLNIPSSAVLGAKHG